MKKKILAIILSAIVALSLPTAMIAEAYDILPVDVGNYHRYNNKKKSSSSRSRSRSSSRSSSRSRSSSSSKNSKPDSSSSRSYSNYSGSVSKSSKSSIDLSNPEDIVITVGAIIFIIVLILFFTKTCKGKKKSSENNSNRIIPYDFTPQIAGFIQQNDKNFNAGQFLEWSKNIFVTLQTAWTQRDWEKIRTLEKEELFEQHNTQLQEYIRLGRINVIENINVSNAYLHKLVIDDNYEHLTVSMFVTMNDYIIDEKSGKVLMGNKKEVFDTIYQLTFIRRKGIKTAFVNGAIANVCPHCGAAVNSASAGRCEYCGSIIHTGEFNWVLSDMEGVEDGFYNDNRGIIILNNNQN